MPEEKPSGFVGRRKMIREFIRLFRDRKPPAFCITGAGGTGKSTLSARLSDILEKTGYMVVPLRGELTADAFIKATKDTLVSHKEPEHIHYLESPAGSQDKITCILSNIMGQRRVLYLLDNFEDNLKRSAGFKEFENPFWEQTFRMILEVLPHTCSCILITCQYAIPGIPETLLLHKTLAGMTENEVRKLVLFNRAFGENEYTYVSDIYKTIGGNPKAIEELGVLLAQTGITWKAVKEKLLKVSKEMRQFTIFNTLFGLLPEPVREFFFKASVYTGPVPLRALQFQEPDEEKAGKYLGTLLRYGLIRQMEDIVHHTLYYQIHPLNREYAESLWKDTGGRKTAGRQAALYYMEKRKTGGEISAAESKACSENLDDEKEYGEMAGLLLAYTWDIDLKGFRDESESLLDFIIKKSSPNSKKAPGATYNNIGLVYSGRGEWDKALEYFFKAEKTRIEVGDRAGLVATYFNMGTAYMKKKDNTTGEPYIILAGYVAITLGMKEELNRMARALDPVMERLGREEFMKQGAELARARGIV